MRGVYESHMKAGNSPGLFLCKNIWLSQEMTCISLQQERTHNHGKEQKANNNDNLRR